MCCILECLRVSRQLDMVTMNTRLCSNQRHCGDVYLLSLIVLVSAVERYRPSLSSMISAVGEKNKQKKEECQLKSCRSLCW